MSDPSSSTPSGVTIRTATSLKGLLDSSRFGPALRAAAGQGDMSVESPETRIEAIQPAVSLAAWTEKNPHAASINAAIQAGDVFRVDATTPAEDIPLSPARPTPGLRR
jgi:hypothetical protein